MLENNRGHGRVNSTAGNGAAAARDAAPDPLHMYVASLPEITRVGGSTSIVPITDQGHATAFGARTLAAFTGLQARLANGTLAPDEAEYFRYGSPLSRELEGQLAALDCGEAAVVLNTGMTAIHTLIQAIMAIDPEKKSHFVVSREGYRKTRELLTHFRNLGWLDVSVISAEEFKTIGHVVGPATRVVFFETPSNPFLTVVDVAAVKEQVSRINPHTLVVVDHTFANPYNQKPLTQGADVVVPSLTKYVVGDNSAGAGAVIGTKDLVARVGKLRGILGGIPHDESCRRIQQGLQSLECRNRVSNRNAMVAARLLEEHPLVAKVWYPGLPSHPSHEVAANQMGGFGGVVSFELTTERFKDVASFVDTFVRNSGRQTFIGPSFGGQYPLISSVPITSHFQESRADRYRQGISDGLLRLSVGTIDTHTLVGALKAGLSALGRSLRS